MNINFKYQKGMTLMELLVAGFISIIVSSGMVILMASTLGTGTQTIKMTQLSKEMRAAMQIMTRELRRANYIGDFAVCFGDIECTGAPTADNPNRLNISDFINSATNANGMGLGNTTWGVNDCLWFWYDRSLTKIFGTTEGTHEPVAAFRRAEDNNQVGIIQMTVLSTVAPTCTAAWDNPAWADITNPDVVDIEAFVVEDLVVGFESYELTINGTQSIERIEITMTGRLLASDASLPAWLQDGSTLPLTIRDFIRVRNDITRL